MTGNTCYCYKVKLARSVQTPKAFKMDVIRKSRYQYRPWTGGGGGRGGSKINLKKKNNNKSKVPWQFVFWGKKSHSWNSSSQDKAMNSSQPRHQSPSRQISNAWGTAMASAEVQPTSRQGKVLSTDHACSPVLRQPELCGFGCLQAEWEGTFAPGAASQEPVVLHPEYL